MSELTPEAVRKVARLARLALTDEQVSKYAGQMGSVLGYIERLRELDLKDAEPMTGPVDARNRMDEDVASAERGEGSTRLGPMDVARIAPEGGGQLPPFVSVPKVLGDDGGGA